jgi:hypothetical protein
MGIDEEIQRRMDAYRGNPQGLQQRYQMSQQLLDLLALQKLKSEKDSVARQMQAQMQQMPGTVAQQREQEMLGRTKQEMAQQVGGVMRQQAMQQQQNAARMAQAMARPQGGIAGLAPQGARMAGGGIVAFKEGDLIQTPDLPDPLMASGTSMTEALMGNPFEQRAQLKEEIARRLEELNVPEIRVGSTRFLPEARKMDFEAADELRKDLARLQAAGNDPSKVGSAVASAASRIPYSDEGAATVIGNIVDRARDTGPSDIDARLEQLLTPTPVAPKEVTSVKERVETDAGSEGGDGAPPPEAEREKGPTYTKGTAPEISIGALQGLDALRTAAQGTMTATEPSEEALLKKYGNMLGLGKLREVQEKGLAELAALDKAQLDPEKLRRERVLRKFAAAGAGRSMAQTGADVMLEQEKRERDRLRERMNIATEIEAAELGMNKDLLVQSLRTVDNAKNMKIKGMEMLRNLGRDEFERSKANAEMQWNKYKEENAERFREYTSLAEAAARALRSEQADEALLSRIITDINKLYADEREVQRAQLQFNQRYQKLLGEDEPTAEQLQELKDLQTAADATALGIADEGGLLDLQDGLVERLLGRLRVTRD